MLLFLFMACGDKAQDTSTSPLEIDEPITEAAPEPTGEIDITDIILDSRSGDCGTYVQSSVSNVMDVQRDTAFTGIFDITLDGDSCIFTSNAIPNHDFNEAPANFATPVSEQGLSFTLPQNPSQNSETTGLTLRYDNAVFLNGVKLDLLAAACYGVGPDPLGQEKVGCSDANQPWRYDPMYSGNNFGTDSHNAHTQPDGTYHYHGDPLALYDDGGETESPVIGFAADGFPIFGPYINDNGTVRMVVSGYTLKEGDRVSIDGEGAFPGGSYDGTFRDDYEFTGEGDLDACNGMEKDGVYGYYVTNSYPWVLACFMGTPDTSFQK